MEESVANKIMALQDELAKDPEYLQLRGEYARYNGLLVSLLESLTPEQGDVIWEYMEIIAELHLRILVLAVSK